ncbi:NHL domain-containing thioredoxin family protein [Saxibacter everestensis]|uniref:NHL domain-containing thioredoxin family protein n=1 Tax=Saxibacter everestensis TaxID=2909229 RepID=A0ABY8QSJ2_9MICO|nr:NHL domain-containing thioredoxin family protein [Brevibacteriaceae bacterium ZFBP1038]
MLLTRDVTTKTRVRAPELVGRRWLNTGGKDVTLQELRGKIVLLDFWTFCCINCLHVLDELRPLEEKYSDILVIIGVHSPKFEFERSESAVETAVSRYEVQHPVLDDPNLDTWQAYAARAWPTLAVVDPEGYVVANMSGEGHAAGLAVLIEELIAEHEEKGTLHRGDGPYVPPAAPETELYFPGKVLRLPDGGFLVSDSGHHRLLELAPDAETVRRRFGDGERGLVDGDAAVARFSEPQGLTLLPAAVSKRVGYHVVVADTVNHVLRGLNLDDGSVITIAGTGEQYMVGAVDNVAIEPGEPRRADRGAYDGPAATIKLSSPWDVLWSESTRTVVVAMAGNHTVWSFDPLEGTIANLAGTMNEGLLDGSAGEAWFAQTSGLAADASGRIWTADSETSALRYIEFEDADVYLDELGEDPEAGRTISPDAAEIARPRDFGSISVRTAVGEGLFDFGFRDGPAEAARLQHPLGVTVLPDGSIAIADTYNGAIRRYDPARAEVGTLARDLAEPSDAVVVGEGTDNDPFHLLVVESAAHRLTRVAIPAHAQTVDDGAKSTSRPSTDVAAGTLALDIGFVAPTGQKLDDRYGDPTWLQVSSTPPELLGEGSGGAEGLTRKLSISDGFTEGILHITARAAACDGDPVTGEVPEHAACHLYQQDWGIPVRVVEGGATELALDLRGAS